MRKKLLVLLATGLSLVLGAGVALAHPHTITKGDRLYQGFFSGDCKACHESQTKHTTGPHGGYTASTAKCNTCHDVHIGENSKRGDAFSLANTYNEQLLPGQTLTAACNYCHDLTQSKDGPYNVSGGMTVGAAHRVMDLNADFRYTDTQGHINDTATGAVYGPPVNAIPGGSYSDGWEGYIVSYANTLDYSDGSQGRLSGSYFTCDSCHTPHGINTVNAYLGESDVKVSYDAVYGTQKMYMTTRLLKQYPNKSTYNGNTIKVTEYGSQWCLGCHNGRDALGSDDHNHPVNETLKGYQYQDLGALVTSYGKTTVDGVQYIEIPSALDPRSNQQYALTVNDEVYLHGPRPDGNLPYANYKNVTSDGSTTTLNGPACQQCHGSARDVEATFAPLTNPARLSFPHISEYKALLVENDNDDFCTNCHAPSMLP